MEAYENCYLAKKWVCNCTPPSTAPGQNSTNVKKLTSQYHIALLIENPNNPSASITLSYLINIVPHLLSLSRICPPSTIKILPPNLFFSTNWTFLGKISSATLLLVNFLTETIQKNKLLTIIYNCLKYFCSQF